MDQWLPEDTCISKSQGPRSMKKQRELVIISEQHASCSMDHSYCRLFPESLQPYGYRQDTGLKRSISVTQYLVLALLKTFVAKFQHAAKNKDPNLFPY